MKFKVTKYYVNELSGTFEAENKEEAEKEFDKVSEEELDGNYLGCVNEGEFTTRIEETV